MACATQPLTPTELRERSLAAVYVQSMARWNLLAPPDTAYQIEFVRLNGKTVCHGNVCPVEMTLPAGHDKLVIQCLREMGPLFVPLSTGYYAGDFIAGHTYGLRPVTMMPRCTPELLDMSVPAKPTAVPQPGGSASPRRP